MLILLSACQPNDNSKKTIDVKTETKNTQLTDVKPTLKPENKSKDFSVLVDQPYDVIESDEACSDPVVLEFFAYQCPHCYKLEEFAEKWKKSKESNIKFQAVPTHLGHEQFGSFLIVHQAAKNLGLLEYAIPGLFKRLHEEKKAFSSPQEAVEFLVSIGATKDDAEKAINDNDKIKDGMDKNFALLAKYKIAGVPTMIVNHRYQFDVTKAGGYDKVFKVVEETLKLPSNCSK